MFKTCFLHGDPSRFERSEQWNIIDYKSMRDNYTTVYSYLKNKIDSFQRFHRWNVEIKHLSSILFLLFHFLSSRLHVSTGWERSSVCTFFENSFNGNKPWKIERFESFLISMHFPRSDFSSLKKNNFERIEFNTSVNLIWLLYCSLSRQSV